MENVTDRVLNPFDMRPPCDQDCSAGVPAVFGYGDANADVHVVGDHPGVHGGRESGVPFTGTAAARRLQEALAAVGLIEAVDDEAPTVRNCFLSYLHACCPAGEPTAADYARLERFFDAELRAIAAHVLVPVGDRATAQVIESYTGQAHRLDGDAAVLHATEVRGRGFLVVPVREPADWSGDDRDRLVERLRSTLDGDYRQTVDLGHFGPGGDPYLVR